MVVNGFELPVVFVQLCEAIQRGEAPDEWRLKEDVDAYGRPWEVADLRISCDPKEIQSDTELLSKMFNEGGFQHDHEGYDPDVAEVPGSITGFTGVANFVCFACATNGMPYCFDFGVDAKEPGVVYWEESGSWRRVAPNFETFIALFIDSDYAPYWEDGKGYEKVSRSSRTLLAAQALRYVLASRESFRRFFADVGDYYAACSEEERHEVIAEVREELELRGMTNEQRRTLDELWERLRVTVNGFELPVAFVRLCEAIQRGDAPEEWALKAKVDAYGHPWENFGLLIYTDPDWMAEETRQMVRMFREQGVVWQNRAYRREPGFVHDFTDIANYVRFGTNNTGEMFCFDFGANPEKPSVVFWEELGYWRRVAPSFETFIDLFIDEREAPPTDDENYQPVQNKPPTNLARQVLYFVTPGSDLRHFVEMTAGFYAQCSAEERREVEADVREELERRGMTDEQRRRLDEVWERLRASLPS